MKLRSCRFYRNQPVKRMRRGPAGLILTLFGSVAGTAGRQLTISQEDWQQHGEVRQLPVVTNDELRQFVAR